LHHIDTSDEEELPANASPEEIERARITRQVKKIAELAASKRNQINGKFYDVRIKKHNFRGKKQVVIVFSNISAEKAL